MKKFWKELGEVFRSKLVIAVCLASLLFVVFADEIMFRVLENTPYFYKIIRNAYVDEEDRDKTLQFLYQQYSSKEQKVPTPEPPWPDLDAFRTTG